jgi:hypothetical protein
MPATIGQIKKHLDTLGVKYMSAQGDEPECGMRFSTSSYADPNGDRSLLIICRLSDDGHYLELYAPNALNTSDCKYKAALFSAMLQLALQTKHVQLEHDPDDGEIRFAIDYPVCDGTVTAKQIDRMIFVLIGVLEQYYPVLRHAMDTGKIDWTKRWKPE